MVKRIIRRHLAVLRQTDNLARQFVQLLRAAAGKVIAERDVQIALAIKRQPRADVGTAGEFRRLLQHHLKILQLTEICAERAVTHYAARAAGVIGGGITEPHPTALREVRRQHHIQQTALAPGPHVGYATNRLR